MKKIFLVFLSLVMCCTMIYAAAESTSVRQSQPVAAESVEAFNGIWVPCARISAGLYTPLTEDDIATLAKLSIENGTVTTHLEGMEDGVFDFIFEDGVLKYDDTSSEVPSRGTLSMQDDGYLSLSNVLLAEGEEIEIVVIYNRQDAAEEIPAA